MAERRALWVSTSTHTRGGIATYVRDMQSTALWSEWNIRHVTTHKDGKATAKIMVFACGAALFILELIRFRPDVVHLHTSADTSFVRKCVLFWISRFAGVPVVVHVHASDFGGYYDRSPRSIRKVIRRTLDSADAVIALGEVLAERLRVIAPSARITSIPNAIQLGNRVTQRAIGEPVRVVFLGRIGDRKGTFRLLDAWAELAAEPGFAACGGSSATLTIAGDGEVDRARRRIEELGLTGTVDLVEWLPPEAVGRLLDRAHVLVLPSRNEGQPMAVLEAMARGLCVVASEVGGLKEMIGEGAGRVVPADDVSAIADALRAVIHDGQLRAELGAAAYARAGMRFEVHSTSRSISALYREICVPDRTLVSKI